MRPQLPKELRIGKNSFVSPYAIVEQPENVRISDNVQIKPGVVLRPEDGYIIIRNNVVIDHYTVILAKGGVEIGEWCTIAPHCGIYAQNYSYDLANLPITKQPNVGKGIILMGDNWIGANSIILDDVTLGKGTIVGAGAVVTKSFPMAKVVAGNPARIIKNRFPGGEWDFETTERCSVEKTPDKFWSYIKKRAAFAAHSLSPEDVVLDVGCGEGYVTNILKNYCRRIIGIDYSEEAINKAKQRYGLECYQMRCTDLRFEAEFFDKVICTELLEHLTLHQAWKCLSEIYRVLKAGGMLVGSTPLRKTLISSPRIYSHIYEYSKSELKKLLEKFFEDINIDDDLFIAKKRG